MPQTVRPAGVATRHADRAIAAVGMRAAAVRDEGRRRIERITGRGVSDADLTRWVDTIRRRCRLTINFHPDRVSLQGQTVADGLATSGRYLPQYVTGLSNGGRSARPGGDRPRWERELFADAYDQPGSNPSVRPVYGAVDLFLDPHGGSPRFGSCAAILDPAVFDRCTFTFGDSHIGPTDVGTDREFTSILAALFEAAAGGRVLGRSIDVGSLSDLFDRGPQPGSPPARVLDDYIEVQVHGPVSIGHDIVAVQADPSFRFGPVGVSLARLRARGVAIDWHDGSELPVAEVPNDFRGPNMASLAAEVADRAGTDALVDAAAIGVAAARLITPSPPRLGGDGDLSPEQQLKYLWHVVLAHGRPPPTSFTSGRAS